MTTKTTPRCPHCGYTNEDSKTHMDHHLCKQGRSKEREIFYDYNDSQEDVDLFNERTGGGVW